MSFPTVKGFTLRAVVGLEPRLLVPESNTPSIRPPQLYQHLSSGKHCQQSAVISSEKCQVLKAMTVVNSILLEDYYFGALYFQVAKLCMEYEFNCP